jgi:MFS family permease
LLLAVFLLLCVSTLPLFGGRIGALAELSFRGMGLLTAGLGTQVLLISVIPNVPEQLATALHVASYVAAGAFVWLNRRIAGLWLIGVGGALNFVAITANGGVMPAAPAALETAGLSAGPSAGFSNSIPLADPVLFFLGDVFAVPSSWPVSNVFSIGDVLIAFGAAAALHRISGSRLVPSGKGQFSGLTHHPSFMRVWLAQAVSNLGDWVYALSVGTVIAQRTGNARALAIVLAMQVAPGAIASIMGGPLIDRMPRKRLMISADLARALAVGSLLLFDAPSLPHLYGVAVCLGVFGALFQPSLQASLPNLVPENRLVAANALVNGTFHAAITVGPVMGSLLVSGLGAGSAFALNAGSFCASAFLLLGVRIPGTVRPPGDFHPVAELREGFRYIRSTPLVRSVMVVTGVALFASALRSPLEPLFVFDELHSDPRGLGLIAGTWGLGMILGSIAAPAISRMWSREVLLGAGASMVGVCVFVASRATAVPPVLVLWIISGAGNAVATIAYESLLQERTPDRLRGRVVAASESVLAASFVAGVGVAGALASDLGLRATFALSGILFITSGVISHLLLGRPPIGEPGDEGLAKVGADASAGAPALRETTSR